jgi:hypothetical protein
MTGATGPQGPAGPTGPAGASGAGVITDGPYADTSAGVGALQSNGPQAYGNTALGYEALASNINGVQNTAVGTGAQNANPSGAGNTSLGFNSLASNTSGSKNTAIGNLALVGLAAGSGNTAIGSNAFENLGAGSNNIGIGSGAGAFMGAGSNNIDIGYAGGNESATIRLGTSGTQTRAFIAGIYGTATGGTGAAVVVDANGQLGTVSSSRHYKEDIQAMGEASDRLLQLRPVTFHYKKPNAEGDKPLQFGLIAEEVAAVMPELVVNNKDGQPETVAYHLLPALLLNELQKEHRLNLEQSAQLRAQNERILAQQRQIDEQKSQLLVLASRSSEIDGLKTQLADLKRLTARLVKAGGVDRNQVARIAMRDSVPQSTH